MAKVVFDNSERDRQILAIKAVQPKLSNDAIGAKFGISRERVRQILGAEERRQRRAAANERVATKFRGTFEKYERLRLGST
jgi:DNA-directed RNA polymerase sigma subunit (sigma70/sigma32)